MLWYWRVIQNLILTFYFKNGMRNLENSHTNTQKSENFNIDGLLLSKIFNVWVEKLQRIYMSWHGIFIPALEGLKIWALMGFFSTKYIIFEVIQYTRVIFYDTEKWCKIRRKTDLWYEKWHEKFGQISSDHWKALKFAISWALLSKVCNAWAKKVQRV